MLHCCGCRHTAAAAVVVAVVVLVVAVAVVVLVVAAATVAGVTGVTGVAAAAAVAFVAFVVVVVVVVVVNVAFALSAVYACRRGVVVSHLAACKAYPFERGIPGRMLDCRLLVHVQLRAAISDGEKELEAVVLALRGRFKSQSAVRALVGA